MTDTTTNLRAFRDALTDGGDPLAFALGMLAGAFAARGGL
jgi:hypothetical protein